MKKKLLPLFFIFIIFSLSAQAQNVYYIDSSTGSDASGDGSSGKPWKTLLKACNSVTTSGSVIHVNPGTYLENTRITLSPGVSIEGEGNTSVITNTSLTSRINYGPNGSNGDAIINLVSSSVINGNQEIRNLKFDGSRLTCSHALYIMNRHNVKIHHCTFVDFNYSAVAWWASGTADGIAPASRLTGSEFYNNTVTNCAGYNSNDDSFYGALYCGGHKGMLIHDNTMIENGHSSGNQGWPIKFWLWGGMMSGCKIYNNWLEKTDYSVWDFAIESTGEDGLEIYNNTIRGGVDLNKQNFSGEYPYSVHIHDNTIGPTGTVGGMYNAGITLEHNNSHVLIERNLIQNCSPGILFTPRNLAQTEVTIRYNIFKNIKTSTYYTEGITMIPGSNGTTISGFYVYNNVFYGTSGSTDYGIRLVHSGGSPIASASNVQIANNIFVNFNGYNGSPVYLTNASAFSGLNIQNNIFYNSGSNAPLLTGTPTNYTYSGNITSNPLFVTAGSDFHLQSGSPAIDAGKNIGLTTDFELNSVPVNSIPDIGAYEYGGTSSPPSYLSSLIANATPSILEMTYNMTLANIVPATSAFTVRVNSTSRTVSSVSVSGTKVSLTLASPVVYGDAVTVAYTKPSSNPLQTSSGSQAASISAQNVTNNVAAPAAPVYVSSQIANATPAVLEMTYNMTLANIVPATSAFTVRVNSTSRTVSSVSVSGTKVSLTLASPVVYGDAVTVAYTKPSTNPLQTSAGGQAASISAQNVTNNLAAPAAPVYVSSQIANATPAVLEMTYNMTLANIVPATSAFTVRVNSTSRTVSSVSVSGTKVSLTLASPVVYGDAVTVAYTKPSTNPLQTSAGGQAASISAQNVTNNLAAPAAPVYVSSQIANATPAVLEMTYNMTLANIVPATSAFTVRVNSTSRTVSSVSVSGTKVSLTLPSPVVYGDVVTVAYTKPSTNPLQTSAGGQAASISAQNVTNNLAAPAAPVYVSSQIANATPAVLEMTYNMTLANIVPAASAFTVRVNSTSRTVSSVSVSGTKVSLTLASPVVYGDAVTVAYTKPSTNPLQTPAGGQAASISAQNVANNVAAPGAPAYVSSQIANATPAVLEMTFSMTLANIVPPASAFTVRVNSTSRGVSSVTVSGTKVSLTLASPAVYGDVVTIEYTKPSTNPLQTPAGGQAASISAQNVTNNVAAPAVPAYVSSQIANATPAVLEMTYNMTLANIVPAASAFTVRVNSTSRNVSSVSVSGTKVSLTLASPVVHGDAVTVAYTKPSSNPLQTSAGGQAASISAQNVTNNLAAPAVPAYVSSQIANATPSVVEMTYNMTLANIVPAASAFTVRVNSTSRNVSSVSVSGTKVSLTLASPVVLGDAVTVAYTKPSSNPLQTSAGGQAASISAQNVTNNVNIVNSPPVILVNYQQSYFGGFVGELNASESYDNNKDILTYEWVVPENISVSSLKSPQIKFLGPIVTEPKSIEFTLKVSDGKTTQVKSIPFTIIPYHPELEIAEIVNIEASSFQAPNYPSNISDGNISTMWAAEGENQWLIIELKETFSIQHIKLAFQPGQKKESYFDILGSKDGIEWEQILIKSASCDFSSDLQIFDFPPSKATKGYNFVKLVGLSNSVDSWNYISEFRLYGYRHKMPSGYLNLPVKVFPNPAGRFVNIKLDEPSFTPDHIRILNYSGIVVYQEVINPDTRLFQIQFILKPGVYTIQLLSGNITLYAQHLIVRK